MSHFTHGKLVRRSDDFSTKYKGAICKFGTHKYEELLLAYSEAYAPQCGGYCAYAVANGTTAGAEPELFAIVDGKLYLNYSRRFNQRWTADRDNFIYKVVAQWLKLVLIN